jgi:hypothetical protein
MGIVMAVMVDPSRPDFTEVININSLILFFISLGNILQFIAIKKYITYTS